jgi:hypothetical protein
MIAVMFLTFDLQKCSIYIVKTYHHTKFHVHTSTGELVMKPKAKGNFRMAAMLLSFSRKEIT